MTDVATLDVADGVYDLTTDWQGMVAEAGGAIVAGGFPTKPPHEWFENPILAGLTPLTVENGGRVYGHIAAWHTNHIGMAGGVKPPRSRSQYAFFRTGVVETHDGKFVDVGQITLSGGHAPLDVSVASAVAHYDDTNSAIMDVAAGEDKYGIWVAGSLRPTVTDEQIRAIRASSVSGDWRPINGKLELVAICAVNCPGFPIPRARVASGAPIALIAAGVEPLIHLSMQRQVDADIDAGVLAALGTFRERLAVLEGAILANGGPLATEEAEALRLRVRGERANVDTDIEALRRRVRPTAFEEPEVEAVVEAEIEDAPVEGAVEDDDAFVPHPFTPVIVSAQEPEEAEVVEADAEPLAAALRGRVHGSGG